MIDNLSITVNAFGSRLLMSFLVDETLFPSYVNLFTNFKEPPFSVEISFLLKTHILHIHGGQCYLLPAPDYATGIRNRFLKYAPF